MEHKAPEHVAHALVRGLAQLWGREENPAQPKPGGGTLNTPEETVSDHVARLPDAAGQGGEQTARMHGSGPHLNRAINERGEVLPVLQSELGGHAGQQVSREAQSGKDASCAPAQLVRNESVIDGHRNGALPWDGGAAPQIAATADRFNLQRLVVVAMVVITGGGAAINALALARRGQRTVADRGADVLSGNLATGPLIPIWMTLACMLAVSAAREMAGSSGELNLAADAAGRTNEGPGTTGHLLAPLLSRIPAFQKQVRVLQFHGSRNAAILPVLHPLDAALLGKIHHLGNLDGSAKVGD